MKAKKHNLIYGIKMDGSKLAPITDYISSYTLELLEPVDGISSIEIVPLSLGEHLAIEKHVNEDFIPEQSAAYANAMFHENVARRCTPPLTEEQMRRMAAPDYDALRTVVEHGLDPNPPSPEHIRRAFVLTDHDVVEQAYTRLPMQSDRRLADQRLNGSPRENPTLHEAYLTWFITRFGEVSEGAFEKKQPLEFTEFLKLSWSDFLVVARNMLGRDYKELTEILDGKVEVDGKAVPFQGVPEADDQEPKPKGKRGAAAAV